MGHSHSPLIHTGASKSRKANNISDGVDVRNTGLEVFVHHQGFTFSGFETRVLAPQRPNVSAAARRVEKHIHVQRLPGGDRNTHRLSLVFWNLKAVDGSFKQ